MVETNRKTVSQQYKAIVFNMSVGERNLYRLTLTSVFLTPGVWSGVASSHQSVATPPS